MLKKILIINSLLLLSYLNVIKLKKTKVCLCTVGKLENLYVKEYISHYIKLGLDKIFIYDNNEEKGERFEDVIKEYIERGFVEIINFRGILNPQLNAYQDCLNKNYNKYNFLLFYDMDEFIYLKDFGNIKYFLNQKKFIKCQTIQLNMYFHGDNNLLNYDNRALSQRFKKKIKRPVVALKSILKGNIKIKIDCVHNINNNLKSCNALGKINNKEKIKIFTINPDYKFYYIDHFCFKSTEEFVNKLNRGSAFYGYDNKIKLKKIDWYFGINELSLQKINYIEKYAKINLTKYRIKISNKSYTNNKKY